MRKSEVLSHTSFEILKFSHYKMTNTRLYEKNSIVNAGSKSNKNGFAY